MGRSGHSVAALSEQMAYRHCLTPSKGPASAAVAARCASSDGGHASGSEASTSRLEGPGLYSLWVDRESRIA